MTQKERLIELYVNYYLQKDESKQFWREDNLVDEYLKPVAEKIADYLLDNGFVQLPCKIGDTIYGIRPYKELWGDRIVCGSVYRIAYEGESRIFVLTENGVFASDEIFMTRTEAVKALEGLEKEDR